MSKQWRWFVSMIALGTAIIVTRPRSAAGASNNDTVPPIGGHVTDPLHRLTDSAKAEVESLYGRIQDDSKIDVAAFIADVQPEQIEAVGRAAYYSWGIGRDWEGGILIVLSKNGRECKMITDRHPLGVSPLAVAQIETTILQAAADGNLKKALITGGDRVGAIVTARAKTPSLRPPGVHNWRKSAEYGMCTLLVVAGAIAQTIRRKRL